MTHTVDTNAMLQGFRDRSRLQFSDNKSPRQPKTPLTKIFQPDVGSVGISVACLQYCVLLTRPKTAIKMRNIVWRKPLSNLESIELYKARGPLSVDLEKNARLTAFVFDPWYAVR